MSPWVYQIERLSGPATSCRVEKPLTGNAAALGSAVTRALTKDSGKRYQVVADLLGDLTAAKTSTAPTASQSRGAVDCGAAVRQHERRS